MANLEVRIRLASGGLAMPFAEIPLKMWAIQNVVSLIEDVGANFGGYDIADAQLSYQFTDDGTKAYLEVIVDPN